MVAIVHFVCVTSDRAHALCGKRVRPNRKEGPRFKLTFSVRRTHHAFCNNIRCWLLARGMGHRLNKNAPSKRDRVSTSTRWHFAFAAMFSLQRNPCTDCKSAQLCTTRGHPRPFPKLHPGRALRQCGEGQTHRQVWPIYISRRLRLTRNVANYQFNGTATPHGLELVIDWFKVLRPTQHKTGISKTFSGLGTEKQNLTQRKQTFTNQKKCTTTQHKHKQLKPGTVWSPPRLLRHQPGNGETYSGFGAS